MTIVKLMLIEDFALQKIQIITLILKNNNGIRINRCSDSGNFVVGNLDCYYGPYSLISSQAHLFIMINYDLK